MFFFTLFVDFDVTVVVVAVLLRSSSANIEAIGSEGSEGGKLIAVGNERKNREQKCKLRNELLTV